MEEKSSIERGWEFASKLIGADMSAKTARSYVGRIEKAIQKLEDDINNHPQRNEGVAQLQGFMLEEWGAGTFNIEAAVRGSNDHVDVPRSKGKYSIDDLLKSGKAYSAKSYATAEKTAKQQMSFDPETGKSGYYSQGRLVPADKLAGVKSFAHREALRNASTRPEVAAAYAEVESEAVDVITNKEGVSGKNATRKELDQFAEESKSQSFKAEKHGITIDTAIKPQDIMKQAARAGLSAAVVTMIMQTAPEIYKAIDYLIKTGELEIYQIRQIGTKAITSGAEGFLRGSVACTLQILCEKGVFGEVLKKIEPNFLGVAVALTIETIKNSILVATGKMAPREMGAKFVDGVVVSAGFIAGTKLGATIGGAIGQVIGFKLPVVGYILGSLIGCAFSAVYNIGKKKLISFCVDTGFTCFGLVDQDYQIPEDVLRNMGIDITPILRTEVEKTEIPRTEVPRISLGQTEALETIDFHVLRRGIIGVNKVGYVY